MNRLAKNAGTAGDPSAGAVGASFQLMRAYNEKDS